MIQVCLEDFPEELRLELSEEGKEVLWQRIEEEGIKQAAKRYSFSPGDLYNWRSKDLSVPVSFAAEYVDQSHVEGFKSGGKSDLIHIRLPFEISEEFLTRIELSVSVNKDGVPVYYTSDRGLMERFRGLMEEFFSIEPDLYSREGYEVRFPKSIFLLVKNLKFERDTAAEIDETGEIEEEKILLEDRVMNIHDFEQKLYSRSKRLDLALAREDSESLEQIISEELQSLT